MNRAYIDNLMNEINFPQEAKAYFNECMDKIEKSCLLEFDGVRDFFFEEERDWDGWKDNISPRLEKLAEKSGIHKLSLEMLMVLELSQAMKISFEEKGYSHSLFIDTCADFTVKLHECQSVYGVWGTFVAAWYPLFFYGKLVKLGRLEYEDAEFDYDLLYDKCGIVLQKGSMIKSIHIPSGEPLTQESCYASYKNAYDFYKEDLVDGKLICICDSWLLHKSTEEILPQTSNTVRFVRDFDIITNEDGDGFPDKWRVFGKDFENADIDLPEKTSMQKAYKKYILSGGKFGSGLGILIFDGERIVNI